MRLWITEKPEMAKSLAAGIAASKKAKILNGGNMRSDGCLKLDSDDWVAPLFGHMLESARPQAYYDPKFEDQSWFQFLPLVPPKLIMLPKADRGKDGKSQYKKDGTPIPPEQFWKVLELIKKSKEIVNAGDTDREGQLIVDELLEYAGIDPTGKNKPIWRLALENPKEEEIVKLLAKGLERNGDTKWVNRRLAALCRSVGDWCMGMSCSMAWQEATGHRRLAIGRVQTPVVALVVARDKLIENFKPVQYFVPVITLGDGTEMRWDNREGAENSPGFDSEGRIIDRAVAQAIVARISAGQSGTINLAEVIRKQQLAPLPFSLGTLQSTAARNHGMTLQEVTKAAQSLYERHKCITYVGTDCQFLPTSMLEQAHNTMQSLSKMYAKHANGANLDLRSKAWNDEKTDEHFAIIPNGSLPGNATPQEKAVFDTIARRYMAQFYPAHEFLRTHVGAIFGQDSFKATRKEVTRMGWKEVEGGSDEVEDDSSNEQEVEVRQERQTQK